jgi:ATP-dependent Clp protease, protease subunit
MTDPLLQHRILFLREQVSAETANQLVAQLLLLDADDHSAQIDLYINSPGGSVVDGMAIVDAIQCIQAPVSTICIGQAVSMAAWILAAGTRGRRAATPHAEITLHQAVAGFKGRAAEVRGRAERIQRSQDSLVLLLAGWTGKDAEGIRQDMERDLAMSAEAARVYGLIDEVLEPYPRPTTA